MEAFHQSSISIETQAVFIKQVLTGDLLTDHIPGVGKACIKRLNEAGITSTFQFISKFLSFKGAGVSGREHCQLFSNWLKEIEVSSHRNNIVVAIADKCSVIFPHMVIEPTDEQDDDDAEEEEEVEIDGPKATRGKGEKAKRK